MARIEHRVRLFGQARFRPVINPPGLRQHDVAFLVFAGNPIGVFGRQIAIRRIVHINQFEPVPLATSVHSNRATRRNHGVVADEDPSAGRPCRLQEQIGRGGGPDHASLSAHPAAADCFLGRYWGRREDCGIRQPVRGAGSSTISTIPSPPSSTTSRRKARRGRRPRSAPRLVDAELVAQHVGHLAQGGHAGRRHLHRHQEVLAATGGGPHVGQSRAVTAGLVAPRSGPRPAAAPGIAGVQRRSGRPRRARGSRRRSGSPRRPPSRRRPPPWHRRRRRWEQHGAARRKASVVAVSSPTSMSMQRLFGASSHR